MKIFNWLKRLFIWIKTLFGFNPKKDVKVIKLKNNTKFILPTEAYKIEHKTLNYYKGNTDENVPKNS